MLNAKDIADLEKKYSKYIFKKRFKTFLFLLLIVAMVSAGLYFSFRYYKSHIKSTQNQPIQKNKEKDIATLFNKKDANSSFKKNTNLPEKISKKIKKVIVPEKKLDINVDLNKSDENTTKKDENLQDKLIFKIYPSNIFSIDHSNTGVLTFIYSNSKKIKSNFTKTKASTTRNNDKNVTITNKKRKKPRIDIEINDIDSIKYLNNKFKKTHDIVFALMLCETYYKQKDYKKSLRWSIIANDIDSESERSWMWFAKSKYRLHQKSDAIKALKSFLRANSSENIKSLLRDIINGELND